MKSIVVLLASIVIGAMALPAMAQGYRIQSGDTLLIEVLEDESLNREVLVPPDGRINIPLAGTLRASGRSVEQVSNELAQLLAPNFASQPNVFVSLGSLNEPREPFRRTIDVFVIGEAGSPGRHTPESGTTLLQFFGEMGGFSRFAATKRIMLRRTDKSGKETVYQFNYDAMLDGTGTGASTKLADGDVIVIPERRLFE
ncbi:polysaccharide biosynthesis/export family protein (plasmid) [Ruegeria sp. SCSIO 43209]|uniref:polysaccharide biosynthesis/export family protein n=1 Tax=Ruegeria sp. SCSIO 43209 TaxID=2793010 RepID=UPI00147DCD06|nr:polysaccharide biosynthesis/export family protein [Ruegeria sp. SCSIO 43209]UAB91753.1 polysaccharide biosynthesis/export family protein [Ruegeria sp. SCSIO 43209]